MLALPIQGIHHKFCFIDPGEKLSVDSFLRDLRGVLKDVIEQWQEFLRAIGVGEKTIKEEEDRDKFKNILLLTIQKDEGISKMDIYNTLRAIGLSDFAETWKRNYIHPSQYTMCVMCDTPTKHCTRTMRAVYCTYTAG